MISISDILNKFKRKNKGENIIKKYINILSIQDDIKTEMSLAFAFSFIKGEDGKKKAIVSVNEEKVILDRDQECIFVMKSGDSIYIRLRVKPDFIKEGCHTTWCHDPNIKDEDI